jgi:hypothetical protein
LSEPTPDVNAETTAKLFRGRVLKPAEGVFLFHPRAMERLVADHLDPQVEHLSIPELAYYLMPAPAFLRGLESENPEALAVIEGLNLPNYVILLPIPPEQRLDRVGFTRLLRDYWSRRFEAEVARSWLTARDDNRDADHFGPAGLIDAIGPLAFAEIRDVLLRDGIVPTGIDDAFVCRSFIALVARLRYFSPGARGFFFPTIRDWRALDRWMVESGLDLPGSGHSGRLPRLLEHTRPDHRCGAPAVVPLLPTDLPYGLSDPDFTLVTAALADGAAAEPQDIAFAPVGDHPSAPNALIGSPCTGALMTAEHLSPGNRRDARRTFILRTFGPLLDALLAIPDLFLRRRAGHALGRVRRDLRLALFGDAFRRAQRAELSDRHAAALAHLALAGRRLRGIASSCFPERERLAALLDERVDAAEGTLAHLIASHAKLAPSSASELRALTARLAAEVMRSGSARTAHLILRDLERVLLEGRTTYYRLRPWQWLTSRGGTPFRQILPFQAQLKGLRALEGASNRLEQLAWPITDIERFAVPLERLSDGLANRLANQLRPHLRAVLDAAGFTPANHREQVAAHKMREELLDVIRRRRHLKFTDVRDIVARNILRLPDPTFDELRTGDRLAQFDRLATQSLPGVYKPGEFYIKGLQQLGAPLFGTRHGRLLLRHLVLPVGLAFLGLKTLDILIGLLMPDGTRVMEFAQLWLVASLAGLINAVAYTRSGRAIIVALWRALCWSLRLLLFDGIRKLLRWGPIARVLTTDLARGLDRNLLQPLLIGALLVLPFLGIGLVFEGFDVEPGLSSFLLAFAIGTLIRNTPAGRRMLDNALSAMGLFLRRINQTLVIGLVQELLHFFKEVTRRFEQGLHRIEELLSHQLGESRLELTLKALFAPVWKLSEAFIQFYVTVLIEPQINPIKHFPLVTIAHKLMLPFLPALTGLMVAVTDPFLPKLIAYPFVTITILLLPGLAGFLVWELKENWKIYAANHAGTRAIVQPATPIAPVHREDLTSVPIEPAIIGSHGETMRGMLRRGFHSGTLPKAFDRLRRVIREEIRDELPYPQRLRDARRRLREVNRALCIFCDRELGYALRRRCKEPGCALVRIETGQPRLSSNSFDLTLALHAQIPEERTIDLNLRIYLDEPDLCLQVDVSGPAHDLGPRCWELIRSDIAVFSGRAGAKRVSLAGHGLSVDGART